MTYPYFNDNGKRRANHKEWDEIRAELSQLKSKLQLTDDEFRLLSPYDNWREIQNNIYQKFCKNANLYHLPTIWQNLDEYYAVGYLTDRPEMYLNQLIDNHKKIWFIATNFGDSKLWFCEGNILVIQKVIDEMCFFDEVYFVCKKYEWLIAINHHDVLMATGKMIDKLKALENHLSNLHIKGN